MCVKPLKTMIQPRATETPMTVANGRHMARNPNTIMPTPHPMEAPAACLKTFVVPCAVMFFSPCPITREMQDPKSHIPTGVSVTQCKDPEVWPSGAEHCPVCLPALLVRFSQKLLQSLLHSTDCAFQSLRVRLRFLDHVA